MSSLTEPPPPPRPKTDTRASGRAGEEAAQALLERRGYRIVDVNVRLGARRDGLPGEIDIVAWDGPALCFVEVKTRRARRGPASAVAPAESVTPAKQRQIARLALAYAARHGLLEGAGATEEDVSLRFDVVSVLLAPIRAPENGAASDGECLAVRRTELLQGAFLAPEGFEE